MLLRVDKDRLIVSMKLEKEKSGKGNELYVEPTKSLAKNVRSVP